MTVYPAGDASINVRPSTRDFRRELDADLKKIDAKLAVQVTPNLAQAQADLARWREQEERRSKIGVDVHPNLAQATADMARFRAKEEANAIDLRVNVDQASISRATRGIQGLASAGAKLSALKWNAGALALGSLPALTTGLVTATGAAQELAQVAIGLPGIFAGVASSVGTAAIGFKGMGETLKLMDKAETTGKAKDIAAAAKALEGLAPAAQEVTKSTFALIKGPFKELQNLVAQNMFDGMSAEMNTLADKAIPRLKVGLGGIATAWNQNLRQLTKTLGSDSSRGLLDRILGDTANAQSRFTKAIDPIVHGLGVLTAGGTSSLPRLADGIDQAAQRFDRFITAAADRGDLDKWINDGITGMSNFGNALLNVGKSLTAITQAAGGGGSFLAWLERATGQLATFLNSAQGQEKLTRFFAEGREQLEKWGPVLQGLPGIFQGLYDAAKSWSDVLLPALGKISTYLGEHPGLIQAVATAFIAWKTIAGVTSLVTSLTSVANLLKSIPGLLGTASAAASSAGTSAATAAAAGAPSLGATAAVALGVPLAAGLFMAQVGGPTAGEAAQTKRGNQNFEERLARSPFKTGATPPAPGTPEYNEMLELAATGRIPGITAKNGRIVDVSGNPIPGLKSGGPTPSGKGPGPTGGWLAELHDDEWVLPAPARAAIGDEALWALTQGRSFLGGGYIDTDGNPVSPGAAPGPGGSVTGGVGDSFANSFLGGLGLGGGPAGSAGGQRITPGLWGLAQVGSDPAGLEAWGGQTAEWAGKFAANTLGKFGSALWSGALGIFGLENSILSPNNVYNQAIQKAGQFYLGDSGPFGGSGASGDGTATSLAGAGTSAVSPNTNRHGMSVAANRQYGPWPVTPAAARSRAPKGTGAERWRPIVTRALQEVGPRYGITNVPAWSDAMIGQIQFESGGNAQAYNGNDTDGKGGRQKVYGLGQFLTSTFNAHNITGGSINSGEAQIYAMIDYVATKYGQSGAGVPNFINQGHGYAAGGPVIGVPGIDTNPAMLTRKEWVIKEPSASKYGTAAMASVNAGTAAIIPNPPQPGMSGMQGGISGGSLVPLSPMAPTPAAAPAPTPTPAAPPSPAPTVPAPAQTVPTGPSPTPAAATRPTVAPAPSSDDHTLPALKQGITEGAAVIGDLAAAALSSGGGMGGGGGAAAGVLAKGMATLGGKAASGVANVFSSALVGNLGDNTTAGAYGAPVLSAPPQPARPIDARTMFGDVSTNDPRDFVDRQLLHEQQRTQTLTSYV
ncbi:hypothetical protein [Mycobacteroides salmoniphilum]|uniref:hypothetical protein n=2 Tax=Bacteria TaxID=2 RepID=UPI0010DD5105|nr:hypothetical protein [Mycobacteroides salmoniphilum]TDZ91174.1 hypothetical protein CCUG62472_04433 [Mycobacteroides salmoniphilum]